MTKRFTIEDQQRKKNIDNQLAHNELSIRGEVLELKIHRLQKELERARNGASQKDILLLDLVEKAISRMMKSDPTSNVLKSAIYNWLHSREEILKRVVVPRSDSDILLDITTNRQLLEILDQTKLSIDSLPISRN